MVLLDVTTSISPVRDCRRQSLPREGFAEIEALLRGYCPPSCAAEITISWILINNPY